MTGAAAIQPRKAFPASFPEAEETRRKIFPAGSRKEHSVGSFHGKQNNVLFRY
jgi:hypothetical protein